MAKGKPRMHRKTKGADTGSKKGPARKPLGNGRTDTGKKSAFLKGKRTAKRGGTS